MSACCPTPRRCCIPSSTRCSPRAPRTFCRWVSSARSPNSLDQDAFRAIVRRSKRVRLRRRQRDPSVAGAGAERASVSRRRKWSVPSGWSPCTMPPLRRVSAQCSSRAKLHPRASGAAREERDRARCCDQAADRLAESAAGRTPRRHLDLDQDARVGGLCLEHRAAGRTSPNAWRKRASTPESPQRCAGYSAPARHARTHIRPHPTPRQCCAGIAQLCCHVVVNRHRR